MAAAIPFAIKAAPFAISAISGLFGKKSKGGAATPYTPNPAYTKPLTDFGGSLLPMAQSGFKTAMDYYTPLAQGDQQALATATASDAASTGRQVQQLTQRAGRTLPRGGASAAVLAGLPQQQLAAGLERRIGAQQNAAQNLASVASTAGGIGTNIFGNLLGNELGGFQTNVQQGYLDLARTRANRDYYGGIGGGIFDILTGSNPSNPGSILDKIMGKIGGKGSSGAAFDDQFQDMNADMWAS